MRRVQNSVRIVGELLGSSRSVKERTSAGRQQRQISKTQVSGQPGGFEEQSCPRRTWDGQQSKETMEQAYHNSID